MFQTLRLLQEVLIGYLESLKKDVESETRVKHKYMEDSGGARGVMAIVVGNGHGDMSSNPGPG